MFDTLETRAPAAREAALLADLPNLIARAQQAPGWAQILKGVDAASITSRAALAQLPITRKSDLHAVQNKTHTHFELFGGLTTTPTRQLRRLFMSPGPIFDPEGQGADWWRFARSLYACGFRAGDILQNCFSYHFTPAAFMVEGAAQKLGCAVIPAGTGNTEMQVQAMVAMRPDGYVGTPSFLKMLIEKAREMGADISSLKRACVGGEALPPSLRAWINEAGVFVTQLYATADIGSIAYETVSNGTLNPGMMLDESLLLEIVRPGTGTVCAAGEVGEIVITSFNLDYPLIRFATGDMSKVLEGASPCGRTNTRIAGWLGRADQTTKVRGMFVHPTQVAQIVQRHSAIQKARLVVSGEMGNDAMRLLCEVTDASLLAASQGEALCSAIAGSIREVTKLRGEVALLATGGLPNDGKVIEDARSYK